MNIGIIGAGAIGLLCAYHLNKKHEVTLYVRSEQQIQQLRKKGLCYTYKKETKCAEINVKRFEDWIGEDDLTIVAVKQYQMQSIYMKMEQLSGSIKAMLFLQNGMSHLQMVRKTSVSNVMIGMVEHGAMKENEHTVVHTGIGAIKLSVIKGSGEQIVSELVQNNLSSFQIIHEPNYLAIMQRKLFVNSIVNPLTSILKIQNGQLLENDYYHQLMNLLMEEIVRILSISDSERVEYQQYCLHVIKKTAHNKSSMLRDIEENRETEIDAILGYIIEEAKRKKIKAPISTSYYYMVKGIEQTVERSGKA